MSWLREAWARIAGTFTKNTADDDLRDELRAHLEMEIAEFVRRGMSPVEARRQAMLASGGVVQATEAVRDQRGLPWLESIVADIRYATRALLHSRAFAAVVVLTLALGIGANTAIFSVVRGVLLKPLPHRDGGKLVYLRHATDRSAVPFSVPEVVDLREGVPAFSGIAEYSNWSGTLIGDNDAISVSLGLVTGNYFDVMGLRPVAGRVTRPSDDGRGVPPVMVLTHEFWMRRYGGDPGIVGKQVKFGGSTITVIGVLEPAPFFPSRIDALTNMVVSPHHLGAQMVGDRVHRMTELVARLAPGATLAQARTQVNAVNARMLSQHPEAYDVNAHFKSEVLPFRKALGQRAELTVWLLMAAAAFVMIISAANVANLTLMRGVRREHELVVRAALGAGSGRLRRMLLVENLMLTLLGAGLGLLIALGGVDLLVALAARYSTRSNEIGVDFTVLGFTLGLAVGIALLMSWVSTLPKDGAFASWISAGARRMTGGVRKQRLQRALVVAQIAVTVVLLAGAGLLTRTMIRLSDVNTGLRTEDVLTLPLTLVDFSRLNPETDARAKLLYASIRDEIAALPGVREVGVGSTMPLRSSIDFEVRGEGVPLAPGEARRVADLRTADPHYFSASGIPLLKGRPFATSDNATGGKVVIVNSAFADKFFPGQDAVGRRMSLTGPVLKFTPFTDEWRTIVGVVGNTQDGGPEAKQVMVVFMPFDQTFAMGGGYVIRSDSNVAAMATAVTRIVRRTVPTVPINDVLTVRQIKNQSVTPRRLNAMLVSLFGVLALLIASVGIAGVLAFSVSARTNEIGIRMSLGAERGTVQRMILREGGVLVAAGLVLGVAGAYVGAGVIRGLLFGVAPTDPVTFVGVAVMMGAIGLAACWVPALRASRIDPAITMRAS